jgi:transcriptional regulator with XRE-family HTH domain
MEPRVGDLIKETRGRMDLTQSQLADMLGVTKRQVQRYEAGDSLSIETLKAIGRIFGSDFLSRSFELYQQDQDVKEMAELEGFILKEDMFKFETLSKHQKLRLSLKNNTKPIPVSNTKAAAGMVQLVNDEPELILDYIDAPFIGIVDGVVECVGHSMYPVFPNGSRIAVRKLEDKTLIQPGEFYYLIDTNYEGYVKRLYAEEDGLVLSSENPDKQKYPPFKRKWSQIVSLFKVKADITKH